MADLSQVDGKSALGSISVWGSLAGLAVSGIEIVKQVASDPTILAIIPPHIVPFVIAGASLITLIGRITAKKQITGVIVPK